MAKVKPNKEKCDKYLKPKKRQLDVGDIEVRTNSKPFDDFMPSGTGESARHNARRSQMRLKSYLVAGSRQTGKF